MTRFAGSQCKFLFNCRALMYHSNCKWLQLLLATVDQLQLQVIVT